MGGLFNIINVPLGYVMRFLARILGGNFAAAVAVFTLLINALLIPLSIKSQKSAVSQMRIKPKMDELKKRFGDDRQKMAMEQQKLYQDEGVSMAGGCLPMIIRLLLMMSIYSLILSPLTYMANTGKSSVDSNQNRTDYIYSTVNAAIDNKTIPEENAKAIKALGWGGQQKELVIVRVIINNYDEFKANVPDAVYETIEADVEYIVQNNQENPLNFNFFGLDLTRTPNFDWDVVHAWQPLWLIPIGAFAAQIFTSFVSMRINKKNNPDAPTAMGMMLIMSSISLIIGFSLPGGVGFYWICSSLIGGLIQAGVQLWYGPHKLLARERAKELCAQCDFETKQIAKFNENDNTESMIKD